MSIEESLKDAAINIADTIFQRSTALEPEKLRVEERLAEIEAIRNTARLAAQRFGNYMPILGVDYQCPRCWVINENRSALRPVPSNTIDDVLRCDSCSEDFVISMS